MAHGNNFRPGHLPYWMTRLYDPHTEALTVIEEPHRLAHDGMVFSCTGKATGLTNGSSASFLIVTGANVCHMHHARLDVGAGDVDLIAYEDATTSANGSALGVHNTNRNSTKAPTTALYGGPTITDNGTLLHTTWGVPTGTGVGNSVGLRGLEAGEEWLLQPNSKYLYMLTNNSGGTIDYGYDILFYESTYAAWV